MERGGEGGEGLQWGGVCGLREPVDVLTLLSQGAFSVRQALGTVGCSVPYAQDPISQ